MSISMLGFISATFNGRNGAGSISVPGLRVGDKAIGFYNSGGYLSPGQFFETIITVDDELQQTTSFDIHLNVYEGIFVRTDEE